MRWLIALETEQGLITPCRLMNIFRRKGLKIITLAMAAQPSGYSITATIESPEENADHVFNVLRRTEGVRHVIIDKKPPVAKKYKERGVAFAPP